MVYQYPSAIVFDLDYTLWPWWCDYHISPPVRRLSEQELVDSSGLSMQLFPDIGSIFEELSTNGIKIIGASRTATPEIAIDILSSFFINGKSMISYFHSLQWGEYSKVHHITRATAELGMKEELESGKILLFDDEERNRDVASIRCHFALVTDYKNGLTRKLFEDEMKEWTNRQS